MNILIAPEWCLKGARACQREWRKPTRVHKGLEHMMSKWPPLSECKPTTIGTMMSNSVTLAEHRLTTNQGTE
jgi:hypothetical protein